MSKILVVDNSLLDTQRLQHLLAKEGLTSEVYLSGAEANDALYERAEGFLAAFILWDLAGRVSGFDLLIKCHRIWPAMPIVVMSSTLDAAMASCAVALGARDFLEKPLDSERITSCLKTLLYERDPTSPIVMQLRKNIIGESPALMATLKQVAKVIPHESSRVLIMGESGTGKELLAKAIHQLGPRASRPWVAINIGEVPSTLVESAMFGHEKGAFTGAADRHVGFLEKARDGTIFLDEIGDLELSLQSKLLRVIQEKEFHRLKGSQALTFEARLVCATNRDLATAVNQGTFRRDLFHRIAEVTIQVPPLRDRESDIDLLLKHFLDYFLDLYAIDRPIRIARETRTILRSYPFLGNIRELENLVKAALILCEGDTILPQHLPLQSMGTFIAGTSNSPPADQPPSVQEPRRSRQLQELIGGLIQSLPEEWLELKYRDALASYVRAFDRIYLKEKLEKWRYNVTQAAKEADLDPKTFRKRWRNGGLPSLDDDKEGTDEGPTMTSKGRHAEE